jgi:hypothetical protein
MSALPKQPHAVDDLTESEAYSLVKYNWYDLQNKVNKNITDKKDKIKDIEELRRVNVMGLLLGIKAPAWKDNELYKLIQGQWDYFSSIGTVKDFTHLLSYKAIIYLLRLYDYSLKTNYNQTFNINRVKTTNFKYTEEQSLAILNLNKEKLEESSGVSIYELKNTTNLTKTLKTNQTYLYRTLKENLAELELLGCSKTTTYNLTYRGVVFLLLNSKYPLDLDIDKHPTTKVIYLKPKQATITPDQTPKETKPNTELIKTFLKKAVEEKKARAIADIEKAEDSKLELQIVNDALWHIEQAEELLQEVNV